MGKLSNSEHLSSYFNCSSIPQNDRKWTLQHVVQHVLIKYNIIEHETLISYRIHLSCFKNPLCNWKHLDKFSDLASHSSVS